MDIFIKKMNEEELDLIENKSEDFDKEYIGYMNHDRISLGAYDNGKIIGGVDAYITVYKSLFVATMFVEKEYRRKHVGTMLMLELENKAKEIGANMIRLDTYSWQGKEFYESLNYEMVGSYKNDLDNYEEYFFLKRIN